MSFDGTSAQPNNPARLFRRRGWFAACAATILLALVTLATAYRWTNRIERVRVNFITEPFEATIELDGVRF